MKKIFLSIMLFILSIPLFVNAEEFDVKNFYVNIDVQNNGDAIIEYYFDLNGSYNGYDLKIDFKNNNTFYFNSNLNSLVIKIVFLIKFSISLLLILYFSLNEIFFIKFSVLIKLL